MATQQQMHKPGNGRPYSLRLVSALLCLLPLTAAAVAPVVDTIAPTDIRDYAVPLSVDATLPIYILDLETKIGAANPAVIVVEDDVDGATPPLPTYNFSPTGSLGPLFPGVYTIDWTATDLGLNSRTETQTLNVLPSVNLELSQEVGEGGTAIVTAHLSGKAPSYPVTIPYTVTNNAPTSAADHGAGAGGNFVFNADETETSISFTIVDDGAGDAGETITITLGALPGQVFSGHQTTHTITITETNTAPLAQLHAEQNGNTVRVITADGGTVTICAMPDCGNAYDANGDTVTYDWSASDNALAPTAGTTSNQFIFEPAGLGAGFYTVRLTVSDGIKSSSHDLLLRLSATTPTLSNDTDSDQDNGPNGGDDAAEGIQDDDNDGILNYLDAIEANPTLMQGYEPYTFDPNLIVGDTMVVDSITLEWSIDDYASNTVLYPLLMSVDPGHEVHLGPTVFAAGSSYARITSNTAETLRGLDLPDGIVSSDGQVIDVEITNLGQTGGTARIIVPMVAPIPAPQSGAPEFIVFNNVKTWDDFSYTGSNDIKTTTKTNNYCSGFDAIGVYLTPLTAGDECLLITIVDGGPNDYDGLANGSVRLMGGVFISSASTPLEQDSGPGTFSGDSSSSVESLNKLDLGTGGGSGTLDLLTLLGLLLTPLWRQRQTQ